MLRSIVIGRYALRAFQTRSAVASVQRLALFPRTEGVAHSRFRCFSNAYMRRVSEDAVEEIEPAKPLYKTREIPPETITPSGWSPPLGVVDESLPFRIERTASKQLPVYRRYRNGRTRVMTVVRKYTGDQEALAQELERVLGGSVRVDRHVGSLEVHGDHLQEIVVWLRKLGF